MSISQTRGRRRAPRRPITQIITDSAEGNLATASRRSAVVVASSGLLVSMLAAPAANAAPENSSASLGSADSSALTEQARAQLNTAPSVLVADASWEVSVKPVKVTPKPVVVTPPPAPEPPAASRTAERTEPAPAPAAPAPTPEPAPAPAPEPAPKAAPAASAGSVIGIASRYVGVPYVYGGSSPGSGFDCSGFTSYVYAQVGITLPRSSGAQRNAGTVVPRSQAQPGDLIWSPGHIAIYAGGNMQYDAPRPGKSVQHRTIWQSNPTFIRVG